MFRNLFLAASVVCINVVLPAHAEDTVWLDLKPDLLSDQLLEIAKIYDVDVVFRNKDTAHKTNGYVVGQFTTQEALEAALSGSQLRFHQDKLGSYIIEAISIDSEENSAPQLPSEILANKGNDQSSAIALTGLDPLVLDTVLLKGSMLSNIRSLKNKRLSDTITESVFSDELGQIPSNNIGESINRLPGVSMLVEKGEGRYFQIRGINPTLNNITLNGTNIGSPETESGGRQAPLDMIASGVVDGVVIRKVRTPDMDGQGIGGTLDVETKSPFDRSSHFDGQVSAKYGFEEISALENSYGGSDPFALETTLSAKSSDQKWGMLLSGAMSEREYVASGIYQDDWSQITSETGDRTGAIPNLIKNNYYVIGRKRRNLNSVLEYRPNDTNRFYATTFWARWEEFQHRNRYEEVLGQELSFTTPTTGEVENVAANLNLRLEEPKKTIFSIAGGGEHHLDNLVLSYKLNSNQNQISEPNVFWKFATDPILGPESFIIDAKGIVHLTPQEEALDRQSPTYFKLETLDRLESEMKETSSSFRGDLEWFSSADTSLKTGIKYRSTHRERDFSEPVYLSGISQLNLATSSNFTHSAFENCNKSLCAPNILLDINALEAFYADAANSIYFQLDEEGEFQAEFSSDYMVEEDVFALYLMGKKAISFVDLIAGLRIESTQVETSGYLLSDGAAKLIKQNDNYTNWLPSLIATWNLHDNLLVRTSVSRAIGRPDYTDIAPRSYLYENEAGEVLQIGNPDLSARVSWNYDASFEWYPNDLSLLYVNVFHKDISDDIVEVSQTIAGEDNIRSELNVRGLDIISDVQISGLDNLQIQSFINAGSSRLTGIELGLNTRLDSVLPSLFRGFSIAANATILDGETIIDGQSFPLLNQADHTYALSFLYQNKKTDASISYAYNDSYLTRFDHDNPNDNLSQGEFGRWDAKLSYTFNDGVKLFLEGVNLNNEPTTEFQGSRESWNTEHEYVGRTVYLGLSYGF